MTNWDLPILAGFLDAAPTAELTPLEANQTDEEEMGLTYDELSVFGRLRKIAKYGPWSCYQHLTRTQWAEEKGWGPRELAEKVMHFYRCFCINRHKVKSRSGKGRRNGTC